MDNIKTWTGLSVEESIRMTEDRGKWRKYVHGVANPRIEDGYRTEHNSLVSRPVLLMLLMLLVVVVSGGLHSPGGADRHDRRPLLV